MPQTLRRASPDYRQEVAVQNEVIIVRRLLPTVTEAPSQDEFPNLHFRRDIKLPATGGMTASHQYAGFVPADGRQSIILAVPPGEVYRVEVTVANINDHYDGPPAYIGGPGNLVTLADLTRHHNAQVWMGDTHEAKLTLNISPEWRNGVSLLEFHLGSLFIPMGGAGDRWDRCPDFYFHSVTVYGVEAAIPPPPFPGPEPTPEVVVLQRLSPLVAEEPSHSEFPQLNFRRGIRLPENGGTSANNRYAGYVQADHRQALILPVADGYVYRVEVTVTNVDDHYDEPPAYPGDPGNLITLADSSRHNHSQVWMGNTHEAKLSLEVSPEWLGDVSVLALHLGSLHIPAGPAGDRWDRCPNFYFHSVVVYGSNLGEPVPPAPITGPAKEVMVLRRLLPAQHVVPSQDEFPSLIWKTDARIPDSSAANQSVGFVHSDDNQLIHFQVDSGFRYRIEVVVANVNEDYDSPPNYPGGPGNLITLRDVTDWTKHTQRRMADVHRVALALTLEPSIVNGISALRVALGSMSPADGIGHSTPMPNDRWDRNPDFYFYRVSLYRKEADITLPPDPEPGLPITNFTPVVYVQGRTITSITVPNFPAARISHYMLLVSNRYGPQPEIISRSWNRVAAPATLVVPPSNIPGNHYLDGWFQLYAVDIDGNGSKDIVHRF